jgi:hypothetical protein
VWNRFALAISDKYKSIEYLTSTFIIPCSIFVIRFLKVSFSIKLAAFLARGGAHMKLQMFGTVGRATVPAETGRHGGRPYDSTKAKFLFRFDWTLAASGDAYMKLHKIQDHYR